MRTSLLLPGLALIGLLPSGRVAAQFPPWQGEVPVYQMVCRLNGDHLYTMDPRELRSAGTYDYQGVAFYLEPRPAPGYAAVYRFATQTGPTTFLHMLGTSSIAGDRFGFNKEG